jgi:hypothetical protein
VEPAYPPKPTLFVFVCRREIVVRASEGTVCSVSVRSSEFAVVSMVPSSINVATRHRLGADPARSQKTRAGLADSVGSARVPSLGRDANSKER